MDGAKKVYRERDRNRVHERTRVCFPFPFLLQDPKPACLLIKAGRFTLPFHSTEIMISWSDGDS